MSWQTNRSMIAMRNIARRLGLTRILGHFRQGDTYEQAFDNALFAAIQPGDTVWDVGANVGHYTRKFAEAIGRDGKVVAFEPFPSTVKRLRAAVSGLENVLVQPIALGAESGTMTMEGGSDALAATSRVVEGPATGSDTEVEIATGDAIVTRKLAAAPAVLKIDTEGFELDVLRGIPDRLADPALRAVFIEVHFGLLANRGMATAPQEIERILKDAGFATRWVDPSHIAGERS